MIGCDIVHYALRSIHSFHVRRAGHFLVQLNKRTKSIEPVHSVAMMHLARRASLSIRAMYGSASSLSNPSHRKFASDRQHENVASWREIQKEKATGPILENTTSTASKEFPSIGADKPPPELLMSADPDFQPSDSLPQTEGKTEGSQSDGLSGGSKSELGVGEMEGAQFKIEPLRRTGEDGNTLRARLLCPFLLTHGRRSRIT